MFAVSTSVPTTILMVYMILSQLMASTLIGEVYMLYVATGLMLVGFIHKIITLAGVCENGKNLRGFGSFCFYLLAPYWVRKFNTSDVSRKGYNYFIILIN